MRDVKADLLAKEEASRWLWHPPIAHRSSFWRRLAPVDEGRVVLGVNMAQKHVRETRNM